MRHNKATILQRRELRETLGLVRELVKKLAGCGPQLSIRGLMERLWSGLENLHGLSLLQLCFIGALTFVLFSWALGTGLRIIRRAVWIALLLVAAVAVVRLCFPELFCSVRWPFPITALCSR